MDECAACWLHLLFSTTNMRDVQWYISLQHYSNCFSAVWLCRTAEGRPFLSVSFVSANLHSPDRDVNDSAGWTQTISVGTRNQIKLLAKSCIVLTFAFSFLCALCIFLLTCVLSAESSNPPTDHFYQISFLFCCCNKSKKIWRMPVKKLNWCRPVM